MKPTMNIEVGILNPAPVPQSQHKRRRMSVECADPSLLSSHEVDLCLPTVRCSDYYTKPCLSELAIRELMNPGYCSRVQDFVVGRVGYGCVRFFGETDIRCLNVDHIVKFNRSEVVIYEDEDSKPVVGEGLNKPAEVTLVLHIKPVSNNLTEGRLREIEEKLKRKTENQGAKFLSFDPFRSEWKFSVQHFSRFGLGDDDEEDIAMDDVPLEPQEHGDMNGSELSDVDEDMSFVNQTPLSHSLPSHLGLDPARMKDLRLLLLSAEEDDLEGADGMLSHVSAPFAKELSRSPLHHSSQKVVHKTHTTSIRKTPLALLEYNPGSFTSNSPGGILMAQQNKSLHMNTSKSEGFQLEVKQKTPVTECHSRNIVDAGLFMGRSFRVGWGPNGVLVHSGRSVGRADGRSALSSVISLEKVAMDTVTRDDSNKGSEELTKLCFDTTLNLHKNLDHEIKKVEPSTSELKLQKLVCDRLTLPDVCRNYINIIEKQLEVPTLSSASRVLLMHQVLVWELIRVLFSSRKMGRQLKSAEADDEDMIPDGIDDYPDPDQEALPLMRRADFSYWLQECVYHRVQDEVDSLDEPNDLEHMFLLLTGRQLDAAVELAASRGDVRLSSLLSQAGGSTANRRDIARQLDQWRKNGMDFNFIEKDRVRLLELLSGNLCEALHCLKIDWKRYLGLLMWYQLPPDTSLPDIFNTYQKLLNDGTAPDPVPVYIDEGLIEGNGDWVRSTHFDLAYYLMLLHARQEKDFGALKTMLSAFASTNDPLDYHMIWHHRSVLEAIGTFSSNDLHILDMAFVSQLLCLGQCHWAIYVVLHMPHREDYPYLQTTVIREILFQYCEVWSTQDSQWKFIEDLGVPSKWLNEALAVYFCYIDDMSKALHHFLECSNWQKAHSIFLTKVAHSLYLSAKHSEIWRLATSMEDHKSEIEDWDLGAGIYISFYLLRSSLQEDSNTITELDTLENKNDACADFIGRVNKSLAAWGTKLSVDARVVYSKMVEEISKLLVGDCGEGIYGEVQLGCFSTVFKGAVPEDVRTHHLQDAVSLFTGYLSQI